MSEHKSYYATIPANVRYDKSLTANAKLLYGEITALCNEKGFCWASNDYFASLYDVNKVTISRWISDLIRCGYVSREMIYKEGSNEIVNRYLRINQYPINKNVNHPINKNAKDNNTSFNNTFNTTTNTSSGHGDILKPVLAFWENNGFGMLAPITVEHLDHWVDDFIKIGASEENIAPLLTHALEIAVSSGHCNYRYVNGILKNFEKKRYLTVEQVKAEDKKQKTTNSGKIENYEYSPEYLNLDF
ncbi:DnaD domain protein [Candidatus Enterococcus courvalinii]|uniref:DnaD domain protein n=1 Tax=Candidatus Enterococcus courvalinii TaxID=2815329 RepID=A0ABS3HZC0_9ENTE|nr:DnaD domain protein [Enterococcus sp. MSG2901]MBO0481809.1 DnaD domain protein [Enterococcus sp. MSG2901]